MESNLKNTNLNSKKTAIKSNQNKKNSYYLKSIFVVILFIILIIIEITKNGGYIDEIIGVSSIVYLAFSRKKIERRDLITIMIICLIILFGIISNAVSNITSSLFSIGIDIVAETKLIFAYFALKYFLSDKEKKETINMLLPLAKVFTISAFLLSIVSQFVNIGMTGSTRYGIREFKFIFNFSFQYVAVYMLVFGILVCNTKMRENVRLTYYAMAIISIVLATKGPPIMFSIIFVGLSFYFRKHDRISPAIMLIGAAILAWAGWFQIETYLLNENAPRHIFFQYSFKTANKYFPFGSGFATYGSDQAARNYSKLYYLYGFDELNGMNPDNPAFLSDTFWPMAIGQFGWLGSIAYVIVYVRIFLTFKNNKYTNQRRAFIYAAYLQYMIHAIGSAILSSSAGLIGFMAIAIFTISDDQTEKRKSRLKIHL